MLWHGKLFKKLQRKWAGDKNNNFNKIGVRECYYLLIKVLDIKRLINVFIITYNYKTLLCFTLKH